MREPVEKGEIKILPDYFVKTYFHWIENLRDWCISRQIWYGHRIPVYYRTQESNHKTQITKSKQIQNWNVQSTKEEIYVGVEPPEGEGWIQDPDTLDTWFSSGLWTFSTLGWPEKTKDLEAYHPTDILETGYEILFFWVARMIMMSGYALGDIPFRDVYLHGTVRDAKGRKMSKSLGNGIDPIDVAEKFGADAARMALVVGNTPGTDTRIWEDKIKAYKHFANKLWNISRYILMNTPISNFKFQISKPQSITDADKDILAKLEALVKSVTDNLDRHIIHEPANQIYQFVWHEFADIYIEKSKVQLQDVQQKENTQKILLYCLNTILRLLHPFAPFVTEEIYRQLPQKEAELLVVAPWPFQHSGL